MGFSYSKIKTFACPYRYKRIYLDGEKEPANNAMIAGNVLHNMMAKYLAQLYQEGRELNLEALRASLRAAEEEARWPDTFDAQRRQEVLDIARGIVSDLQAVWGGWSLFGIKGVDHFWLEQRLSFDRAWKLMPDDAWFDKKGPFFRAVIDWAFIKDDILYIIDHKTGKSATIDELQLTINAFVGYLAFKPPPEGKVQGARVFYNVLKKAEMVGGRFVPLPEITDVRETIEEKVRKIEENENWGPVPGNSCGFCGFRDECPLKGSIDYPDKRPWEPENPWAVIKELKAVGIPPEDALATIGFTEESLRDILEAGDVVTRKSRLDHLEEIKAKTRKEE